jgi:hypothetical protein
VPVASRRTAGVVGHRPQCVEKKRADMILIRTIEAKRGRQGQSAKTVMPPASNANSHWVT